MSFKITTNIKGKKRPLFTI